MEKQYIRISQYYDRRQTKGKSAKQVKEIMAIRRKLDSFTDQSEQYEWLKLRRESGYNRRRDFLLFGIPEDAEVSEESVRHHEKNLYYEEINEKDLQEIDRLSGSRSKSRNGSLDSGEKYQKRDRHGNLKYNKDGSAKTYGKAGRAAINFGNNCSRTAIVRAIKFFLMNIKLCLTIAGIVSGIITILTLVMYLGGVANSVGSSPFVICDGDELSHKYEISMNSEEFEDMVGRDGALMAVIYYAKERGWKENAIIGLCSYMLTEMGSMGTATYEGCHASVRGPSNLPMDITLDNQKWLDWIDSSGKTQLREIYYGTPDYTGTAYSAVGLGVIQWTNTYNEDGTMNSTNATRLIEAAIAADKFWQDPSFQIPYFFDDYIKPFYSFDSTAEEGIDPTISNLTAEEWCKRICCGIGMPGWSWTTQSEGQLKYINNHCSQLDKAESYVKSFTSTSIQTIDKPEANICYGADSVVQGSNATLEETCVLLASSYPSHHPSGDYSYKSLSANFTDYKLAVKGLVFSLETLDKYLGMSEAEIKQELQEQIDNINVASDNISVAAAVVYSKTDSSFPIGNLQEQINYLETDGKWNYIGVYGSATVKPGDILVTGDGTTEESHIKIYVGLETVKRVYPSLNSVFYESNYCQLDNGLTSTYLPTLTEDDGSDTREYKIYRHK